MSSEGELYWDEKYETFTAGDGQPGIRFRVDGIRLDGVFFPFYVDPIKWGKGMPRIRIPGGSEYALNPVLDWTRWCVKHRSQVSGAAMTTCEKAYWGITHLMGDNDSGLYPCVIEHKAMSVKLDSPLLGE